MKRTPKVFLISPPFSVLPAPLLGVPLLRGYLTAQGIECGSVDLNVRFLRWLMQDRKLLDGLVAKAATEFKTLQQKSALTPQDVTLSLNQTSILAIAPPDLLRRQLGSQAILGLPSKRATDSWSGHMPDVINALELSGLVGADTLDRTASPSAQNAFLQRYQTLESFLSSLEARSSLQQAAAADIAGISVPFFGQQALAGFLIAQHLRKLNPKLFIIFGGSGLTENIELYKSTFTDHAMEVDAIGLYEGEVTLARLAECRVAGESPDRVPNLLLFDRKKKDPTATAFQPSPRPNELPTPIFNLDELQLYPELAGELMPGVRAPLLVSRGCWWDRCAFCADKLVRHPKTPAYQPRSPDKVLDDVEELQKRYGVSYFYLITSAMPPVWGRRFAEGVLERGIKAQFWSYMRATPEKLANEEYFQLLKRAGFDMITVGVESTVDRVLDAVCKGNRRPDIVSTIHGISRAGIRTKFNLIADLPPSRVEDARSNWDFIISNLAQIHNLAVFEFDLVADTPMAENPANYGIAVVQGLNGRPKMTTPGLIEHVNPFYAETGAREIVIRTKKLATDVEFLQLTAQVRSKIGRAGFTWKGSTVRFRPFTALASRLAPGESQPREVYVVILNDLYKFYVAGTRFSNFINTTKRGVEGPVPYQDLLTAFTFGLSSSGFATRIIQPGRRLDQVLDRMAREGFVLDIQSNQTVTGATEYEAHPNPEMDLPLAFERYPFADLPFTFGALPFAGVMSAKMA